MLDDPLLPSEVSALRFGSRASASTTSRVKLNRSGICQRPSTSAGFRASSSGDRATSLSRPRRRPIRRPFTASHYRPESRIAEPHETIVANRPVGTSGAPARRRTARPAEVARAGIRPIPRAPRPLLDRRMRVEQAREREHTAPLDSTRLVGLSTQRCATDASAYATVVVSSWSRRRASAIASGSLRSSRTRRRRGTHAGARGSTSGAAPRTVRAGARPPRGRSRALRRGASGHRRTGHAELRGRR